MGFFDWFKSKDKEEKQEDNSLEIRIKEAIEKCEIGKKTSENKIKEIDDWARDIIVQIYSDFLPQANLSFYRDKYKKEALENYQKIKTEHASKLDTAIVEKCDKIVSGYLTQIQAQNSKLEFFEKLLKKYNESFKNLQTAKRLSKNIDKHGKRLTKMDDDTSQLAEVYSGTYEMEDITKDFELKTEYYKQIVQLQEQYGEDKESYNNAEAYKEEMDKIVKNL